MPADGSATGQIVGNPIPHRIGQAAAIRVRDVLQGIGSGGGTNGDSCVWAGSDFEGAGREGGRIDPGQHAAQFLEFGQVDTESRDNGRGNLQRTFA